MSNFAVAVVSYAVNAAWQVPAIAAAGWVASHAMAKMEMRWKNGLWVLTLWLAALVPAAPLVAGVFVLRPAGVVRGGVSIVAGGVASGAVRARGIAMLPSAVVLGMCVAYLGVLLYFAVRLGWSLYGTYGLIRHARPLELDAEGEEVWSRCRRAFGLKDVRLLISPRVSGPVTMGVRRPVVLAPEGFVARCAPQELLAAMAHECAHIARRDFAKNVVYEAVSLLIAFHPVTWMVKARIAETREMVCDEIAVQSVMEPRVYARSLLRLAAMIASPVVFTNAIGIFDANILEKRIMTIKAKKQGMGVRSALLIPAAAVLFSVVVGEAAAKGVTVQAETQAADGSKAAGKVYRIGGGVSAPQLITSVDPEFSEEARKAKAHGNVLVSLQVGTNGRPSHVRVVRGVGMGLDEKAVAAVRQYRFKPAMKDGKPVVVELNVEVNFEMF